MPITVLSTEANRTPKVILHKKLTRQLQTTTQLKCNMMITLTGDIQCAIVINRRNIFPRIQRFQECFPEKGE